MGKALEADLLQLYTPHSERIQFLLWQ